MSRRGRGVRIVADRAFVDEHTDEIDFYDAVSTEEEEEVEKRLRYLHLPPSTKAEVDQLLRGHVDSLQLPRLPPRTVRLFVSSTNTDYYLNLYLADVGPMCDAVCSVIQRGYSARMPIAPSGYLYLSPFLTVDFVHEKEALMKETFPELRAYCRQSYGIDLQIIDPHWGQEEQSYSYHDDLDLFSTELCRSTSSYHGPHQLVLLGDKLGVSEIPSRIPVPLYNVVVSYVEVLHKDVCILKKWYREDTNALPDGEYVLEPIHEVLGEKWEEREWLEEQQIIRNLFTEGAKLALSDGQINTEEVQQICGGSVLAQEIQNGLTSFETKMLAICRQFRDMSKNSGSSSAPLYTDLIVSSNCTDPESAHQRHILKQQLKDYLDDDGLLMETNINWSESSGMNLSEYAHADHVTKVCRFVYKKAKQVIDESVSEYSTFLGDHLYQENVKHWTQAAELTTCLFGRDDVLSKIEEYILSKTSVPLVISGSCGQGKSTVLAAAVQSVLPWLEKDGHILNVSVIARFCGLTERSSDIRSLTEDICQQISYCTGSTMHRLPKEYRNQTTYLRDILQSGNFRGLLILFIDGLDQLGPSDVAARLDWLPFIIPNNVKVILSASTDNNSKLLLNLTHRYPQEDAVYNLDTFHIEEATSLLIDRLKHKDRRLTGTQLAGIMNVLRQVRSPLDVEAISTLACQMASYDTVNIPLTAQACLEQVLKEAEKKYHPVFVAHALTYLTLADGLSEAELCDILSLDDEVLQYLAIIDSQIHRFPVIHWMRLFGDVKYFFSVIQRDSVDIICWRHSVFKAVAEQRYCRQSSKMCYLYTILADYYSGRGSYVANPTVPRCPSAHRTKVRQLPVQPNVYKEQPEHNNRINTTIGIYNKRRQSQLPKCLLKSNQKTELNNDVLFNFQWIRAKLKSQSVYAVLRDYEDLDACWEAKLVYKSLQLSEVALKEDPDQLSTQLLSRLLQFYHKHKNIQKLLIEADLHGSRLCSYVPNWQCYHSPGAVLEYCHHIDLNEYNSQSGTSSVKLHTVSLERADGFYLLCKKAPSAKLYTWDIRNGFETRAYTTNKGKAIYPSPCGEFINCFTGHGTLQVYNAHSSHMTYEVSFGKYGMHPSHVALSPRYTAFVLPGVPGPYIVDITAGVELRRLTYQCEALVFSSDARLLATHSCSTVVIIEMPLMVKKCSVDIQAVPSKLLFTEDHSKIYAFTGQREVKVIDVNYTYKQCSVDELLCSNVDISDIALSHRNKKLLATALYSLVLIDLESPNNKIHIKDMPDGLFEECTKPFTWSGFSADDGYIIAARGKYVCVWDSSGRPVRLLSYASSTVSAMFISKYENKILTVHENKAIQMWNLDNLREEADFNNRTYTENIMMSANAPRGFKFICISSDASKAIVYNCITNTVEQVLRHGLGAQILSVSVSPDDHFAITVSQNTDKPAFVDEAWCMVRETKLWNLHTGQCIYAITNNTYTVFSPSNSCVVFCPCLEYDLSQPTLKVFNLVIASVGETVASTRFVELSEGVLLEPPIFVAKGQLLCFVMCDGSNKTHLCLHSMEDKWTGIRFVDVEDILNTGGSFRSEIISLKNVQDDQLLVVIGQEIDRLEFDERGCLDLSKPMLKCAVIYDVHSGTKQVIGEFLMPAVRLDLAAYDPEAALFSSNGDIWCSKTGQRWKTLTLFSNLNEGQCCFLMGRRYLAVVADSRSSIIVYRTSDMAIQTKIQIHGQVKRLSTAINEYTLAVTCHDSRICLFTLTLTECDAMTDVISKLPSRRKSTVSFNRMSTQSQLVCCKIPSVSWREMMTSKKVNEFKKLTQSDVINGNGISALLS
ncbi:hypothetical protein LSH36_3g00045 [Paralvinella palmiformis]|uniref:NWD1/2-like winged helix-turn-helix domain-containing protein n=1 Tax=Paralvinella palmiformis TaxID=53620 RepID=A0AAD9KFM9_9ANNE|nr:hypothetical protein LSH36_3g00045 [Paralvinella palmiformis]